MAKTYNFREVAPMEKH